MAKKGGGFVACLVLLFFFQPHLQAQISRQDSIQIDSFKVRIEQATHDTTRLNAYLAWDDLIYRTDPETDKIIIQKVYDISKENLEKPLNEQAVKRFSYFLTWALNNSGGATTTISNLGWVMEGQEELEDAVPDIYIDLAENGAIAVEKIQSADYDLVLMDVQMPVMNGYEATEKIRALDSPKGKIPIIAMTANVMKEEVERCYAAGMDDFIGKPFEVEDLITKISQLTTAASGI